MCHIQWVEEGLGKYILGHFNGSTKKANSVMMFRLAVPFTSPHFTKAATRDARRIQVWAEKFIGHKVH